MQIYALDHSHRLIAAKMAQKQQDYWCLECKQRVRLRGGCHRQNHFYHVEPNRHCHLHAKGMDHLQTQEHLFRLLPRGECRLEHHFPSIKRIADVAWLPHKIIFEIQCSPISAEELQKRNQDYKQLGWQVIWILHDKRYNQFRLSAAEKSLRSWPHYFTDINSRGEGIIYDQFDRIEQGVRKNKLPSLPVHMGHFQNLRPEFMRSHHLKIVTYRLKNWPLCFQGDLVNQSWQGQETNYINKARAIEREFDQGNQENLKKEKFSLGKMIHFLIYKGVVRPYSLFFQMILERMCR